MKKALSLLLVIILVFSLVACNTNTLSSDSTTYEEAIASIKRGAYEKAYNLFSTIPNYKDSRNYLQRFHRVLSYTKVFKGDDFIFVDISLNKDNLIGKVEYNSNGYTYTGNYIYNDNGQLIKCFVNDAYGNVANFDFTYDSNGLLIKKAKKDASQNIYVDDYVYNSSGKLIQETHTNQHKEKEIYNYVYSSEEELLLKKEYIDSTNKKTTYVYTYDYNNNVSTITEIDYKNSKSYTYYFYDDNGKILQERLVSNQNIVTTNDYYYNNNGTLAQKVTTVSNTIKSYYDYEYDNKGRVIKEIYTDSNGLKTIDETTYNSSGNLIYLESISADGEVKRFEADYRFVYIKYDITETELYSALNLMNQL